MAKVSGGGDDDDEKEENDDGADGADKWVKEGLTPAGYFFLEVCCA